MEAQRREREPSMDEQGTTAATSPLFERVAILGLGLMGASLGMAIRAEHGRLAGVVVGYDTAPEVSARATARGAVDLAIDSAAEAVASADLVVLAMPTIAAEATLRAVAPHLAPYAIITDLCSVKEPLVRLAPNTLTYAERYVGGHPMAGSERAGVEAARSDLFRGAHWALTPTAQTAPDALARVRTLVVALGAHPLEIGAQAHDAAVAGISHLPLTLAVALTQTLAEADDWPTMASLAAGGYRDTTRVAAGDPIMGRDILLANRAALLARIDAFAATLAELREAIARGDATAIEVILRAAQTARLAWAESRAASERPD